MKRCKMPKNVTNVAKSSTVFIITALLGEKCNAVLHVMHYIFRSKCTAILSNAVQFSKCTATCNALHSTSLVQYSDVYPRYLRTMCTITTRWIQVFCTFSQAIFWQGTVKKLQATDDGCFPMPSFCIMIYIQYMCMYVCTKKYTYTLL